MAKCDSKDKMLKLKTTKEAVRQMVLAEISLALMDSDYYT